MPTDLPVPQPAAHESRAIWLRGLWMLVCLAALWVALWLLGLLAVLQFLWMLLGKEKNEQLAKFGGSLAVWYGRTVRFVSGMSDDKPFPWSPWP